MDRRHDTNGNGVSGDYGAQNFQVTATSSTTAQLSWNASAGATGYRVYEWNGSQAVQVASLGASTTSTTIGGLSAGATTYFYVNAYNSTSSASTGWVSVTTTAAVTLGAADQRNRLGYLNNVGDIIVDGSCRCDQLPDLLLERSPK